MFDTVDKTCTGMSMSDGTMIVLTVLGGNTLPFNADIKVDGKFPEEVVTNRDTAVLAIIRAVLGLPRRLVGHISIQGRLVVSCGECVVFQECAENLLEPLFLLFVVVVVSHIGLEALILVVDGRNG
jgi:hypothetical protein